MDKPEMRAFFSSKKYATTGDVLRDAEAISQEIQRSSKKTVSLKPEKLPSIDATVLKAIQAGVESPEAIATQRLKTGKTNGSLPNATQLSNEIIRVHQAMARLKKRGLIKNVPRRELPKLREVTNADIKKHEGLVRLILKHGHRFLIRGWQRYIDYDTALSYGRFGLARAIETWDEKRNCKFSHHAGNHIAAAVTNAVRSEGVEPAISIDAPDEIGHNLLDRLHVKAVDPEFFGQSPIAFLLKHPRVTPRELLFFTLHKVYDYSIGDIGKYFSVSKETVNVIRRRAMRKVEEMQRERRTKRG